jgi:hypothetical protein
MDFSTLTKDELIKILFSQQQQIEELKHQKSDKDNENTILEDKLKQHEEKDIYPEIKVLSNTYNKGFRGYKNIEKDVYYTGEYTNLRYISDCEMFLFTEGDLRTQYDRSKEKYTSKLVKYNVSSLPCIHYMYFYVKIGELNVGSKWIVMGESFDDTKKRIYKTFYKFSRKFIETDSIYNIEQDLTSPHVYVIYRLVYFTPYPDDGTEPSSIQLLTHSIKILCNKLSEGKSGSKYESSEEEPQTIKMTRKQRYLQSQQQNKDI